jgi:hypothetical protein
MLAAKCSLNPFRPVVCNLGISFIYVKGNATVAPAETSFIHSFIIP